MPKTSTTDLSNLKAKTAEMPCSLPSHTDTKLKIYSRCSNSITTNPSKFQNEHKSLKKKNTNRATKSKGKPNKKKNQKTADKIGSRNRKSKNRIAEKA